ncbi:MAG: flagellar motor switch protein FliM [Alphaproteobacteria bacterium]|nr:MAG: flagellar motor switch protein FliM [Alphaproteobacteria bacterium]
MNAVSPTSAASSAKDSLIEEIIRMSDFSFERLPMLEVLGERLCELLAESLPDLVGVFTEATFEQVQYLPMSQVAEDYPERAVFVMASSPHLAGDLLVIVEAPLVLTALELALGGRLKEDGAREKREFTAIEKGFGGRFAKLVLRSLEQSFSVVERVSFEPQRVETNPEAIVLAQQQSLCVRLKTSISLAGLKGAVHVVIPYDALEPVRPRLGKVFFGTPVEGENPQREVIETHIERASVDLEVVLATVALEIARIMNWRPGDTFELPIREDSEATIFCGEVPLFGAVTGKRNNGNVAVQVVRELFLNKDTADD